MSEALMRGRVFGSFAELPDGAGELFADAERRSFFNTRDWFEVLAASTLGPNERLQVMAVTDPADRVLALLPGRVGTPAQLWDVRTLASLTNFYSCGFELLRAHDAPSTALARLVDQVLDVTPDGLHLTSLCHDELFDELVAVLRRRRLVPLPYFHFGNWYDLVAGRTFDDYWAARPGALRSTVRRKSARLEKIADYRIAYTGDDLEWALAAYQSVYARSWKDPEPFPNFIPTLVRRAARRGAVRLGVISRDGEPIAAQIWIVWNGRATIFKLAHDDRHAELSPGSVLTYRMMRDLWRRDRLTELDFGRGDDSYKSQWLPRRRSRWGLLALNPRTARGAIAVSVQELRQVARRVLRARRVAAA